MTLKASPLGNRVVWAERIPPDGCQRVVALWKSAPTPDIFCCSLLGHPSRVRCLCALHRGYSPRSHAPVTERRHLRRLDQPDLVDFQYQIHLKTVSFIFTILNTLPTGALRKWFTKFSTLPKYKKYRTVTACRGICYIEAIIYFCKEEHWNIVAKNKTYPLKICLYASKFVILHSKTGCGEIWLLATTIKNAKIEGQFRTTPR